LNVLITCGRFFPSIAIARALHVSGARVDAADPYKLAPTLHSRAVEAAHVVAAPSGDPLSFVADVARIVKERDIDLVVPTWEEGFYLSRYANLIGTQIFAPPFAVIETLHNKANFMSLCAELGLRTPRTVVATDKEEIKAAIAEIEPDDFVARPAFSRGGIVYLTNHGPRAGEMSVDDCQPSKDNPYLVQEYVDGRDACSVSVVRDGKILTHATYEPRVASAGGFAMQLESIDDFGARDVARTVAERFDYTGFLCFDYRRTADGFVMIECNPRSTAGCFLLPEAWLGEAILGTSSELRVAEAGQRRQLDAYLLVGPGRKLKGRALVHELLSTPDAVLSGHDILPAFYCLINRRHFSKRADHGHHEMMSTFAQDIEWDGTPMPELAS
jgi:glutathione synthase/RimK-type ligase-like ATP-grasp enzyme